MRKLKNNFFVQFNIKYITKIFEILFRIIDTLKIFFFSKKYIIKKKIIENQNKKINFLRKNIFKKMNI